MKTGGSVDRLNHASEVLSDAALSLTASHGKVSAPLTLIKQAVLCVAQVLQHSERLDPHQAVQAQLDAGLFLLGLNGCTACQEEIGKRLVCHHICTKEALNNGDSE